MKTKLLLLFLLLSFFSNAQTNLVPNGDFENWASSSQPDNWFRYFNGLIFQNATAQNGLSSTKIQITSGTFNYFNSEFFAVEANKTYRVTMYHKVVSGSFTSLDFTLQNKPSVFKQEIAKKTDAVFSTSTWRKIEFDYTSPTSQNIEVDVWANGTLNSEILVDNISVVDITPPPVQYTLIPDINFEKKLIALGIDSGTADGKVLTENAAAVTYLYIPSSSITDLTGIEDFKALTDLDCSRNQLTSINISKNTKLVNLNLGYNKLAALDITSNVLLEALDCQRNSLTDLNVSKNINLTGLNAMVNQLTALDVSQNTLLKRLTVSSNKLISLNVDSNIALTDLTCGNNSLTSLNVSNNTLLTSLVCHYNKISSLNVSKNILLTELMCHFNELTSLDVTFNLELYLLDCLNNKITSLDISKNPKITELACENNSLTYLNLKNGNNIHLDLTYSNFANNPDLTCIQVDDATYSTANWSSKKDATAQFNTDCRPYTLIPDINFEKKLIALGIDSGATDGKVLTSNVNAVTTLNLNNASILNLSGIEDFVNLTDLNCNSNKLTSLDLSKNIALKSLDCFDNQITSINISKNTLLTYLNCDTDYLTNLDVSNNTQLTNLMCIGRSGSSITRGTGKLTSLNVSKNVLLTNLNCSANQITNLDISQNIALKTFNCGANRLSSLNISNNTLLTLIFCGSNDIQTLDFSNNLLLKTIRSSSNKLTSINVSKNTDLTDLECNSSLLTSLDVSKNPALTHLMCGFNNLSSLNLKNGKNTLLQLTASHIQFWGNPNLKCIEVDDVDYSTANWSNVKDATAQFNVDCTPYTLIPDPNFEDKLIALGIDKDGKNGKVKTADINNITLLDVSNSNISDLTGLEDFAALKYFFCTSNKLTTVDFSKNLMLENVDVSENNLTSLDVSKNIKLRSLRFSQNQISSIDISKNINLESLDFNYNKVTEIDLTNHNLTLLNCRRNNITVLDLSKQTNLVTLDCGFNSIASLDLTANKKIEVIGCDLLELTSLDVSENKELLLLNAFGNKLTTLDVSQNPKLKALYVEYNPLTSLNIQNGNNKNFILPSQTGKKSELSIYTSFLGNKSLNCIKVDDPDYSTANWSKIKEANTVYSATCSLGLEESVFDKVVLYPNPTKGEVNINNIALEKATVYNSIGQLVKTFTLDSSNTNNTIDLSGLPRGVYYVYLINQDAASAKKIIVE
ncbi:T9SS type A sorting domain-containing protein [Flavobacterium sp. KJJ]|uniref:T9SS type A sorting domain-containing protein n=1 Tax=Flavobacterium sp. KJJ TaxID=1270193 RepID=UPI00068C812E|nr:T9SS type A sorting domain-containing protein [Flavobacterium sp. KJJ]